VCLSFTQLEVIALLKSLVAMRKNKLKKSVLGQVRLFEEANN
jgi:hypothetical protein